MTRRKKLAAAAAALGLSLIGVGVFLLLHRPSGPPPGYDAITVGMSPEQVRAVLHAEPAKVISHKHNQAEIYFLHDFDRRGIVSVLYREGRVSDKAFTPPPTFAERLREGVNAVWPPTPAPTAFLPAAKPAD